MQCKQYERYCVVLHSAPDSDLSRHSPQDSKSWAKPTMRLSSSGLGFDTSSCPRGLCSIHHKGGSEYFSLSMKGSAYLFDNALCGQFHQQRRQNTHLSPKITFPSFKVIFPSGHCSAQRPHLIHEVPAIQHDDIWGRP